MPNMPALIGEGVSCLVSNNCVSNSNFDIASPGDIEYLISINYASNGMNVK